MRRKFGRFHTYNIRIGGAVVDIHVARQSYRCRVCLGELEYHNSGLACAADNAHRGFISQADAAKEQVSRAAQLATVEAIYEIKDGKLAVKDE